MGKDDVAISTISKLAGLVKPVTADAASLPTVCSGSDVNAGGGLRGSVPNETGWLPNKFFSKPVCTESKLSDIREGEQRSREKSHKRFL